MENFSLNPDRRPLFPTQEGSDTTQPSLSLDPVGKGPIMVPPQAGEGLPRPLYDRGIENEMPELPAMSGPTTLFVGPDAVQAGADDTQTSALDAYRFAHSEPDDKPPSYVRTHSIEHEELGWRAVASARGHLEYGEYDPSTPPDPRINEITGYTYLEGDRQDFRVELPGIRGMSPFAVGSLVAAAELDYRVRMRYGDGPLPQESPEGIDGGPRPEISALVESADTQGSLTPSDKRLIVDNMVHNRKWVLDLQENADYRVGQWWPNLTPEQKDALSTGRVMPWDELDLHNIQPASPAPENVDAPPSNEVSVGDTLEEKQPSQELPQNLALEVEIGSGSNGPVSITRVSLTGLDREHSEYPYKSSPESISARYRDNLSEHYRLATYAAENAEFRLSRGVPEDHPRGEMIKSHFERVLRESQQEVQAFQRLCAGETLEGEHAEAMYRLIKRAANLFTRNSAVSFSDTWADVQPRADEELRRVVRYRYA